jgi:hypothetical protein
LNYGGSAYGSEDTQPVVNHYYASKDDWKVIVRYTRSRQFVDLLNSAVVE